MESFSLEASGIAEAKKILPVLLSLVTIPADLVTIPADPVTIPQYSGTNAAESHPAECTHKEQSSTALHAPGTAVQTLNKVLSWAQLLENTSVDVWITLLCYSRQAAPAEHPFCLFE